MLFPLFQALQTLAGYADGPPRRRISDAFPDVPMTNQFGHEFRFRRDFVEPEPILVINTMFTTCRGTCPGTSAAIETLRESLAPVFGRRMTFLSLTLEPHVDTPKKLLSYSEIYGAGKPIEKFPDWHFLTLTPRNLESLRRSLGFFDLDPRVDQDITQHAALLLVGNLKTDRWCKLPTDLRSPVLIDSIRRVAGVTYEEKFGVRA